MDKGLHVVCSDVLFGLGRSVTAPTHGNQLVVASHHVDDVVFLEFALDGCHADKQQTDGFRAFQGFFCLLIDMNNTFGKAFAVGNPLLYP